MLLATCYLLLATCYLLLATCYLLLATHPKIQYFFSIIYVLYLWFYKVTIIPFPFLKTSIKILFSTSNDMHLKIFPRFLNWTNCVLWVLLKARTWKDDKHFLIMGSLNYIDGKIAIVVFKIFSNEAKSNKLYSVPSMNYFNWKILMALPDF